MRTNIVLDDKLVREAMKLAGVGTKREAIHIALARFVQSGRQKRLLELQEAKKSVKLILDGASARLGTSSVAIKDLNLTELSRQAELAKA